MNLRQVPHISCYSHITLIFYGPGLSTVPDPENYLTFFLKVDKVRFKRKVVPGDTLIMKMTLLEPMRRGIALMFGQGYVGDQLAIEGEMMAQIAKVKE